MKEIERMKENESIVPGTRAIISFNAPIGGSIIYGPSKSPITPFSELYDSTTVLPEAGNAPFSEPKASLRQLYGIQAISRKHSCDNPVALQQKPELIPAQSDDSEHITHAHAAQSSDSMQTTHVNAAQQLSESPIPMLISRFRHTFKTIMSSRNNLGQGVIHNKSLSKKM